MSAARAWPKLGCILLFEHVVSFLIFLLQSIYPLLQSQVLLAQRIQHIRRLRASRRAEAELAEWWQSAKPNQYWREAAGSVMGGGEGGKGGVSTPSAAAPAADDLSELLEMKGSATDR